MEENVDTISSTPESTPAAPKTKKNKPLLIGVIVLAIIIIGLIVFLILKRERVSPELTPEEIVVQEKIERLEKMQEQLVEIPDLTDRERQQRLLEMRNKLEPTESLTDEEKVKRLEEMRNMLNFSEIMSHFNRTQVLASHPVQCP